MTRSETTRKLRILELAQPPSFNSPRTQSTKVTRPDSGKLILTWRNPGFPQTSGTCRDTGRGNRKIGIRDSEMERYGYKDVAAVSTGAEYTHGVSSVQRRDGGSVDSRLG